MKKITLIPDIYYLPTSCSASNSVSCAHGSSEFAPAPPSLLSSASLSTISSIKPEPQEEHVNSYLKYNKCWSMCINTFELSKIACIQKSCRKFLFLLINYLNADAGSWIALMTIEITGSTLTHAWFWTWCGIWFHNTITVY